MTITRHRLLVRKYCFRMGLFLQGVAHDLSKYSPVEFLEGIRYWQGDQSPNNAARKERGWSEAWLHHKGRNRHHLDYWIDYGGPSCSTTLRGVPMPACYVAEMVADRIAASRIYLGRKYNDRAPLEYFQRSRPHLWFVHEQVLEQLDFFLDMLARTGEVTTLNYIRAVFLKRPWDEIRAGRAYRAYRDRQCAGGVKEEMAGVKEEQEKGETDR